MLFSTSLVALVAVLPYFVEAAVPPFHLSRRAGDAQTDLALDPSQVQSNAGKDGQATPEAGQVPSLTSVNNFINFCLTQKTSITNGLQTKTGSCNPTIMGRIAATDKMPSSKFVNPKNTDVIPANTSFTIKMAIKNVVTGNFVNPATNYYAAPCQVDASGTVIGHSHVVIEKIDSLASVTVTDPNVFAFFKGLNGAAAGGLLTVDVTGGLPAGFYRMASINACANHQPILGAVAQHGSFDDAVYFEASATAGAAGAAAPAAAAAAAPAAAAAAPAAGAAAAAPAAGANLQKFTGAAGGIAAGPITASGKTFTFQGQTFNDIAAAKTASCTVQSTACSKQADQTGDLGGFDQNTCKAQLAACKAA